MYLLWISSVALHLLAAAVWIGGMAFLAAVVVPVLRRPENRAVAASITQQTGRRFRTVGWISLGLLVATGTVQLWVRGLISTAMFDGPTGRVLAIKLAVVAAIAALTLAHDLLLGPRARALLRDQPDSEQAARIRRTASLLGRVTALLSLVALVLGVLLVRGVP